MKYTTLLLSAILTFEGACDDQSVRGQRRTPERQKKHVRKNVAMKKLSKLIAGRKKTPKGSSPIPAPLAIPNIGGNDDDDDNNMNGKSSKAEGSATGDDGDDNASKNGGSACTKNSRKGGKGIEKSPAAAPRTYIPIIVASITPASVSAGGKKSPPPNNEVPSPTIAPQAPTIVPMERISMLPSVLPTSSSSPSTEPSFFPSLLPSDEPSVDVKAPARDRTKYYKRG